MTLCAKMEGQRHWYGLPRDTEPLEDSMRPQSTAEERFWAKVEKTDTCWLWTAALFRNGYGQFRLPETHVLAHRFAYELERGPIPEGLHLDHLCRVKACVRADHLEPVTPGENVRRGLRGVLTTHCPQGHSYSEINTRVYRGKRYCRACDRARLARRRNDD